MRCVRRPWAAEVPCDVDADAAYLRSRDGTLSWQVTADLAREMAAMAPFNLWKWREIGFCVSEQFTRLENLVFKMLADWTKQQKVEEGDDEVAKVLRLLTAEISQVVVLGGSCP